MTRSTLPESVARWLPDAQFYETHTTVISGEPARILDSVEALDQIEDPLITILLTLREAPSRLIGRLGGASALRGAKRFGLHSFVRLERTDRRVSFGLAGRFWRLDFGLVELPSPQSFSGHDAQIVPRLVMTYELHSDDQNRQCLFTHTAVSCPDRRSKALFTPYWIAIRLASGMIRRRLLHLIKRRAEAISPP